MANPQRRVRASVLVAYAAQGLGFAVVLTNIPNYERRLGLTDDVITLVILGVCVCAGAGSVLSGLASARLGARTAVAGGLALGATAIAVIGLADVRPAFFAAVAVYGMALGTVDAAMIMVGIEAERAFGRSLLAGFYAANAAGGVLGALLVSAAAALRLGLPAAMPAAAMVMVAGAAVAGRGLMPGGAVGPLAAELPTAAGTARGPAAAGSAAADRAARSSEAAALRGDAARPSARAPAAAPRSAHRHPAARVRPVTIALLGAAMLAFPVADSSLSSWSAPFLRDVLAAGSVVAPLGYAAYQAALIGSRLLGDGWVERFGRVRVVRLGGVVGAAGFLLVATAAGWPEALLGMAATGLGLGVVAPMAFQAAGDRAREAVEGVSAEHGATGRLRPMVADGSASAGAATVDGAASAGAATADSPASVDGAGSASGAASNPGAGGAAADLVALATDRVVARLNVFTYAGAVLGGVLTGVFATVHHLRAGFVALAALAAVSSALAGLFRESGARHRARTRAVAAP